MQGHGLLEQLGRSAPVVVRYTPMPGRRLGLLRRRLYRVRVWLGRSIGSLDRSTLGSCLSWDVGNDEGEHRP
ncbi:MAG: hypothetical protein AAGC55_29395, partial [Myxococcota bacterium]